MAHKDCLHTGELYLPTDESIMREQLERMEKLYEYNSTRPKETEKRQALLKEMFAEIGDGCYIEPPLRSNWGGKHLHFGKNVYANFNLTLVDDTHIYVGDCTMFGPNVTVATASHIGPLAGKGIPIQRIGADRQKLLDRRRGDNSPRSNYRG